MDDDLTRADPPWQPDPDLVDNIGAKRYIKRDREKLRQIRDTGYFPTDPKWLGR